MKDWLLELFISALLTVAGGQGALGAEMKLVYLIAGTGDIS